jgi:hypothetical protein
MASLELDRADAETLVDLYAMAALQGLLANPNVKLSREGLCATAWGHAEEMFRVREGHLGRMALPELRGVSDGAENG